MKASYDYVRLSSQTSIHRESEVRSMYFGMVCFEIAGDNDSGRVGSRHRRVVDGS